MKYIFENNKNSKVKFIKIKFNTTIPQTSFRDCLLEVKIDRLTEAGRYKFRTTLRDIIRQAQNIKAENILVDFQEIFDLSKDVKEDTGRDNVCGALMTKEEVGEMVGYEFELANYNFNKYKSKKKGEYNDVKNIIVTNVETKVIKNIEYGKEIAEMVNKTREMVNTPALDMTPKKMVSVIKSESKNIKDVKVKVLNKKQIVEKRMGAFLGVAQGSAEEPQLIVVEYNGGKKGDLPLVFVGKAVTYDTGGLGLKPAESMIDMHIDMAGGAASLFGLLTIAKLGIKKNIVAVVPATENAISAKSFRQSDILKSMSGKTIEVRHTDAEGRLILADALTYAQKYYKPKAIIDIATLTGAAVVAVGQHASLIYTNNPYSLLPKKVRVSAAETGNRVWQMPLWDVYKGYMKSKVADLSNISSVKFGGSITAAAFLSEFVDKKNDWIHIDIATRMNSATGDNLAYGAVGEPVYLLIKLAEKM